MCTFPLYMYYTYIFFQITNHFDLHTFLKMHIYEMLQHYPGFKSL